MTKRPLLERLQAFIGITKQEVVVALTILAITVGALVHKWLNKPLDTFNTELNQRLSFMIDSAARSERERHQSDSLSFFSSSIENRNEQNESDTTSIPPLVYRPESGYKKKELPQQPVNINKASKDELMTLPGVGEKMAQKIMAYRKQKPFSKAEDVMGVGGIGEKKFAKMKAFILVK